MRAVEAGQDTVLGRRDGRGASRPVSVSSPSGFMGREGRPSTRTLASPARTASNTSRSIVICCAAAEADNAPKPWTHTTAT
jgi:hypothetical protein